MPINIATDLTPFQARVIEEKKELDYKREKLEAFTKGEQFASVRQAEQDRLMRQLAVMNEYSAILGERITAFKEVA